MGVAASGTTKVKANRRREMGPQDVVRNTLQANPSCDNSNQ